MRIGANVIENYRSGIEVIIGKVSEQLMKELIALDTSDISRFMDSAVAMTQNACSLSAESSATLAATFYDTLRAMQLGAMFGAEPVNARNPVATERAIRSVEISKYPDAWPNEVIRRCTERVSLESKQAAGETVTRNAMRDPAKPKFARVPSGVETCEFCMMLASRGFVYASRKSAGDNDHYHPNCRCQVIPSFGSTEVDGYDPEEYYDKWKHPEKYPELRETRNARRRELYAEKQERAKAASGNVVSGRKSTLSIVAGMVKDSMTDKSLYLTAMGPYERAAAIAKCELALRSLADEGYELTEDHNGKQAIVVMTSYGDIVLGASSLYHIEFDHDGGRPGATARTIVHSLENQIKQPSDVRYNKENGLPSVRYYGAACTVVVNPDTNEVITAWERDEYDGGKRKKGKGSGRRRS